MSTKQFTQQPLKSKKRTLTHLGKIFTVIFSVACGIINASAFITLNFFGGGTVTFCLAAILFFAVTAMNIKMLKNSVPEVLIHMFGRERLLQGLIETENGQPLSKIKKIAMFFSVFFALAVGLTLGALTYSSTFSLLVTFSILGAISAAFPPCAIFLALTTLICMTALMLNAIIKMIKTDNIIQEAKIFLYDLVDTNPLLLRNVNKSHQRIVAERCITIFLTVLAVSLAAIGLIMTMNACSIGLKELLIKIPHVVANVADMVSKAITFGLAMIGQIPFIFRNAMLISSKLFDQKISELKKSSSHCWGKIQFFCTQIFRVIFALGNGLVSMLGAGNNNLTQGLAAGGGIFNSISSTRDEDQVPANNSILYAEPSLKKSSHAIVPLPKSLLANNIYSINKQNLLFSNKPPSLLRQGTAGAGAEVYTAQSPPLGRSPSF